MRHISRKHVINFTLVELLVVIAVITILAGLLLPALKNAKDSVHRTACASNIKQLGTVVAYYAMDYQDWLPPYQSEVGGTTWNWVQLIRDKTPYTNEGKSGAYYYSKWGERKIWFCSAMGKTEWNTYNMNFGYEYKGSSYDVSYAVMFRSPVAADTTKHKRLSQLTRPGMTYLLGESPADGNWTGQCMRRDRVVFRHNGLANMVFGDGHVKAFKATDVPSEGAHVIQWPYHQYRTCSVCFP